MRALAFGTMFSILAVVGFLGPGAKAQQACGIAGQGPCAAEQPYGEPVTDFLAGAGGDPGEYEGGPRWTFAAEAIALQRSTTRSQALFLDATATAEVLNAKNLNFPLAVGPKLSAIRHEFLDSPFDVEVAYFQVDGFTAEASVPGTSNIVLDSSLHQGIRDATARYTSAIYMGDVNLRWQWLDWLTILGGFRMGELNEHYHAAGTGTVAGEAITQDVNTFNHLYGGQLGADADVFDLGGPLQIKAICRAGAFANFASQRNHFVGGTIFERTVTGERNNHTAFVGEAGVVLTYAITQNLAFRASYEAMWVEGVALAPEQIGASDFGTLAAAIDQNGGIFYHGGGLGLEYRF